MISLQLVNAYSYKQRDNYCTHGDRHGCSSYQLSLWETVTQVSRSVWFIHLDQQWLSWMCWSPQRLGAEAQLGLDSRTHLKVRAPRRLRLHKAPVIHEQTLITLLFHDSFINTPRLLLIRYKTHVKWMLGGQAAATPVYPFHAQERYVECDQSSQEGNPRIAKDIASVIILSKNYDYSVTITDSYFCR